MIRGWPILSKRRNWTQEEIDFLKENIGVLKLSTIAKKLDRSYEAVSIKLKRLGMANTKNLTGMMTMGELARHLNVDRNIVKRWVDHHGLPCTVKVTRLSKKFYFIDTIDFWQWAEKNKEKIDFSKIEEHAILPEPAWVKKERIKDKNAKKKRVYKKWTTKEYKLMVQLREEGYTYNEIGKTLGRTPECIRVQFTRPRDFVKK